jgi:signal transduction histidine kinase
MDKSPNLREQELTFDPANVSGKHFDSKFNNKEVRQVQMALKNNDETTGYLMAAMSMEASAMVLQKLRNTLFISFPIVLLILFFISRYLAARSILPIRNIISTTNSITKNNFNDRVPLPLRQDELYELSSSINGLLERIESAIQRERQFTSDASHELRTPLSALRGTLEILIRKPRSQSEYEDKITYGLSEIDRMTQIIEQLLILARFDDSQKPSYFIKTSITDLIVDILQRHERSIKEKNLSVGFRHEFEEILQVPLYFANLILDNIIGNAVKYSRPNSKVTIELKKYAEELVCEVKDEGIGIEKNDLEKLFQPFFRSNALGHKNIGGNGLGLSIARKAADAINAEISVISKPEVGSTFSVRFSDFTTSNIKHSKTQKDIHILNQTES